MKNIFLFDVDGVLCNRGEKIDTQFCNFFLEWSKDKEYYIVTGSSREKTVSQIGENILLNAKISYHCLGNNIWIQDNEVTVNEFELLPEEYEYLNDAITNSTFTPKTGNHFDLRKGSVNFSIVGRDADKDVRRSYIEYDKNVEERLNLVKDFNLKFPRLTAFIGGDISIDICLRGADKSIALYWMFLPNTIIHFFGDRMCQHGVDFPIKDKLMPPHRLYNILHGYSQTFEILKNL